MLPLNGLKSINVFWFKLCYEASDIRELSVKSLLFLCLYFSCVFCSCAMKTATFKTSPSNLCRFSCSFSAESIRKQCQQKIWWVMLAQNVVSDMTTKYGEWYYHKMVWVMTIYYHFSESVVSDDNLLPLLRKHTCIKCWWFMRSSKTLQVLLIYNHF